MKVQVKQLHKLISTSHPKLNNYILMSFKFVICVSFRSLIWIVQVYLQFILSTNISFTLQLRKYLENCNRSDDSLIKSADLSFVNDIFQFMERQLPK